MEEIEITIKISYKNLNSYYSEADFLLGPLSRGLLHTSRYMSLHKSRCLNGRFRVSIEGAVDRSVLKVGRK